MRTCDFDGCDRPHAALGLCTGHYQQHRADRLMVPLQVRRSYGMSAKEVLEHFSRDGVWTGPTWTKGNYVYGRVTWNGRTFTAHSLACHALHGEPPFKGAHARHDPECPDNGLCVRLDDPEHFRWGTPGDNMRDTLGPARSKRVIRELPLQEQYEYHLEEQRRLEQELATLT